MDAVSSVQTVQSMQSVQQNTSTSIVQQAAQGQGSMDFLALLAQLLGGTGEEGTKDILALFLEKGKKDAEEEGVNLAIQMMMEAATANPDLMMNMQVVSPEMISELTGQKISSLDQLLAINSNAAGQILEGTEGLEGMVNLLEDVGQQNVKGSEIPLNFQPLDKNAEQDVIPEAIPIVVEKDSTQSQNLLSQGENEFRSAVSQVKQELNAFSVRDGRSEKTVSLDVDQLQQDVNSGRFQPRINTADVEKLPEAPVSAANIAEQVKEGVIREIGSGKDEFVIKLKPEGLGEITVRLMQTGDKIALSISAANSHVARLLSSELEQLRESLRPYNTVVSEVVDQQAYASNQEFTGFNGSQYQQQYQQQYQNQGSGQHGRSQFSFREMADDGQEEVPAGSHRVISTGLNTYIV